MERPSILKPTEERKIRCREGKLLKDVSDIAIRSPFAAKHGALLIDSRENVLAFSCNDYSSPFKRGAGAYSMHAEIGVINKVPKSQLRGAVLYVIRVSDGNIVNSKPCDDCVKKLTKIIDRYGLRCVCYSS